ncbi:hypothetical protein EXS74_02625 [Candidatus Woesearchaeota archaeon]|nr:hypothetical protein [Candidatus Woesearchaeota archaeon]
MTTLEKLVLGASTLISLSGCVQFPGYDSSVDPLVVLYPGSPTVEDDLHCRVDDTEEEVFDFYWFVNRGLVQAETGVAGLFPSGYARSGDYVECSAWTSASSAYDSFSFGDVGVYIE